MRLGLAIAGLTTFVVVVFVATLGPVPIDRDYRGAIVRLLAALHRNGIPKWVGYSAIEMSANAAMFAPLGFSAALLLVGRWRWVAFAGIPLLSAAIEVTQAVAHPQRVASFTDVVANTLGGWTGVILGAFCVAGVHWRDRRLRAQWEAQVFHRSAPARSGDRAAG